MRSLNRVGEALREKTASGLRERREPGTQMTEVSILVEGAADAKALRWKHI